MASKRAGGSTLERQPSLHLSMDASNIPVSFDVSMSAGSSEATVAAKKASATLSAKKMPRNFRALDKAPRAKLFSDVPLPHLSIPSVDVQRVEIKAKPREGEQRAEIPRSFFV